MQKFAEDRAIIRGVRDKKENEYRSLVRNFIVWCATNTLQLNTSKPKELVIDFGRDRASPKSLLLGAEEVKVV